MKKFQFYKTITFLDENPVKTDLLVEQGYKLVTIGVESGVTISPCIMESEMIFFVVEGDGSITANQETIPLTQGDIVVVPAHAQRSINAENRLSILAVQIHHLSESGIN